jgi:succinoglycan biosynthesis protein ExoM
MTSPSARISICVCAYRRPTLLVRLLDAIQGLTTNGLFEFGVVVVDNDDGESAKEIVDKAKATSRLSIVYDVEPERSISLARNRSVKNALVLLDQSWQSWFTQLRYRFLSRSGSTVS